MSYTEEVLNKIKIDVIQCWIFQICPIIPALFSILWLSYYIQIYAGILASPLIVSVWYNAFMKGNSYFQDYSVTEVRNKWNTYWPMCLSKVELVFQRAVLLNLSSSLPYRPVTFNAICIFRFMVFFKQWHSYVNSVWKFTYDSDVTYIHTFA